MRSAVRVARMEVRHMEPEDTVPAAEVVRAVAEEERWILTEPPVDVAARALAIRAGLLAGDAMWVLLRGDEIVGTLGLHLPTGAREPQLGMVVRADARGEGGGAALLDAALADADT